jgi:hypothetical protein
MTGNALRLFKNEFVASKVYDDFYLFLKELVDTHDDK